MIKIENFEVLGWEHAIRGMRNPMNSWEKSDSHYECHEYDKLSDDDKNVYLIDGYVLGPNDYQLMTQLRNAGTDHRKFMRMITVYLDITAPLYFWKEFDTYKVGTVANSCSTMHKIAEKEFTLDDFSCEHLNDEPHHRDWIESAIVYETVMLNYEVLANIYKSRRNHKLDEWRDFCEWIETLPYSELITREKEND